MKPMGRIETDAELRNRQHDQTTELSFLNTCFFRELWVILIWRNTKVLTSSTTNARLECKRIEMNKLCKIFHTFTIRFSVFHSVIAMSELRPGFRRKTSLAWIPHFHTKWISASWAGFMSMGVWASGDYTLLPSCCSAELLFPTLPFSLLPFSDALMCLTLSPSSPLSCLTLDVIRIF